MKKFWGAWTLNPSSKYGYNICPNGDCPLVFDATCWTDAARWYSKFKISTVSIVFESWSKNLKVTEEETVNISEKKCFVTIR